MTFKLSPCVRKILLSVFLVVVAAYTAFGLFMWRTMHQPPEDFARVMAKMPGSVVFLLFPFETLWTHARAGTLHIGDAAPDFSLVKLDHSGSVQLSALSKRQPVVLVFGSYT